MKRLSGEGAVSKAKELGTQVETYADPVDDGGPMDPDSEAVRDKLEADPALVYHDVEGKTHEKQDRHSEHDPGAEAPVRPRPAERDRSDSGRPNPGKLPDRPHGRARVRPLDHRPRIQGGAALQDSARFAEHSGAA